MAGGQILAFPIDIDRRPYNTLALSCECVIEIRYSPIGRSALYCGLRFKFDIGRILDPRFDCCNLVWNNYLSSVSAELLANGCVL